MATRGTARVQVVERETMNLLGLILERILTRNLARGKRWPVRGSLAVTAGEMCCYLEFGPGGVTICRGEPPRARARLRSGLADLVELARAPLTAGAAGLLAGRLRLGGNPLFLLRLLPLLRA